MAKIRHLGILALGIAGATVATVCDAIHVKTKTLSYPDPLYWKQAGWVFPGFNSAFVSMGVLYVGLAKALQHNIPIVESQKKGELTPFIETLSYFAMIYMLSGFGNYHPKLLCFIFYGTFVLRLGASYEKEWLLIIALLLAFGGMFVEGALAEFDLVAYRAPEVFNVPWWLGGVYLHGAFALREGMRTFVYQQNGHVEMKH